MPEIVISDKYTEKIPRFTLPSEFSNEPKAEAKPETPPATPAAKPSVTPPLPAASPEKEAKPATEALATDAVEVEETPTEKVTTGTDPEKASQRRFERRIDRAHKRAAEAQAKTETLEREIAEIRQRQAPIPVASTTPKMEDFTDIGEYAKAVEKHAKEEAVKEYESKQRQSAGQAQQAKMMSDWAEKVAKADDKYDDFEEVVGDLKPTTPWAVALMRSDNGEEVAYYLGSHQKEAQKIFALDPVLQYLEIGKLSAKLSATPSTPKTPSKAPAPITPVTGQAVTGEPDIGTPMPFEQYRKVGNKMFRGR